MSQRVDLHRALLSAFPKKEDLAGGLYLRMGLALDDITKEVVWPARLAELIQWMEDHGRLAEFIPAAYEISSEDGGKNPDLQAYRARWGTNVPGPRLRVSFVLPGTQEQLMNLMTFLIPWFALLGIGALAILRHPTATMYLSTMGLLLVLAIFGPSVRRG